MYLIGIDIGTSSAKAIVMSADCVVLGEVQQPFTISEPQPGYRIQNPDEVLQAVLAIIQQACLMVPKNQKIAGISFSAGMHSIMAVDAAGKPLTPLMLWADTRSIKQAQALKQLAAANDLYLNCGVPIHPMTPLCKIMWLRDNEPEIFKNAHKFISIKEYLLHYLTGEYVIDHSIASATGMFNINSLTWYKPALGLAGIGEEKLSAPVSVFTSFAAVANPDKLSALPANTPLIIGSSDGCLANIGSGVNKNGDIAVTISTSMAVRITSLVPHPDEAQSLFNYAVAPNLYVCGGGSNNGSLLLHWLSQTILQNESLADPMLFMQKAMTAPAGCDGLVFLPYLLGERAPVWDADASGIITGFKFHHQQQHLMRALVEGLSMNAFLIIETINKLAGNVKHIKASGGFTNSKQWLQMLADITNLPVSTNTVADASAIGAVIVAGYSLGIFKTLQLPAKLDVEKETFTPNAQLNETYQKNFTVFKKIYSNNQAQKSSTL